MKDIIRNNILSTQSLPELRKGEVHLWLIHISDTTQIAEPCWSSLSREEKQKTEYYRFEKDRELFIVRRGIVRLILGNLLNIAPKRVNLDYSAVGKPFIVTKQDQNKIYFNLSHSKNKVLIGFTRMSEIGVDIEHVQPFSEIGNMAERFFHVNECLLLERIPVYKKTEAFYRIWTRKEALLKAIGSGLTKEPNIFDVSSPHKVRVRINNNKIGISNDLYIHDIRVSGDTLAALALWPCSFKIRYWQCGI